MGEMLVKTFANGITLLNLIFGSLSIMATINANYKLAAVFILAAVIMDFMDGRVARKLDTISDFGKELDSLCDLVSFGVAPAILLFAQLIGGINSALSLLAVLLFIACGAWRLARFNILNISEHFVGIPITMAGALLAVVSLLGDYISMFLILIIMTVLSVLMVSNLRIKKIK